MEQIFGDESVTQEEIEQEMVLGGSESSDGEPHGGYFEGLEMSSRGEASQASNDEEFVEFSDHLKTVYRPLVRIDVRKETLNAFLVLCATIEDCEALDVVQVAAALTLGCRLNQGVGTSVFDVEPNSESDQLMGLISGLSDGKAFLHRIASLFRRASRDEELSALLGWRVRTRSVRPSQSVAPQPEPEVASEVQPQMDVSQPESDASATQRSSVGASTIILSGDAERIGGMFREWLRLPNQNQSDVRLAVRQDPGQILSLIQSGAENLGLSLAGLADVTELVVSQLPDDVAADLVADHLSVDRIAEIASQLGDRPTVFSSLISPEVAIRALAHSVRDIVRPRSKDAVVIYTHETERQAFSVFLAELHALSSRDDFTELLSVPLGTHIFEDYVLVALLVDAHPSVLQSFEDEDEDDETEESDEEGEGEDSLPLESAVDESDALARSTTPIVSGETGVHIVASQSQIADISRQSLLDFGLSTETSQDRLTQILSDDPDGLTMAGFVLRVREDESESQPSGGVEDVAAALF